MDGSVSRNLSVTPISEGKTNFTYDWNYELWRNKLPIVVLISLYMVVGCVGNVLVIYIYTISMKMKKVNRFFIPYLAIVDILSLIFNGSLEIVFAYHQTTFYSDVGCKFIRFIGNVFVILSGILLLMIAVQRYVLVCKPLSSGLTLKKKRLILISVFIFTLLISSPKFVFTGTMEIDTIYVNVSGTVCGIKEEFSGTSPLLIYNYILILTGFSCIVTLSVLYILVVKAIHARNVKLREMKGSRPTIVVNESSMTTDQSESRNVSTATSNSNRYQNRSNSDSRQNSISNNNAVSKSVKMTRFGANSRFSLMFFTISLLCIATYAPRMTLENIEAVNKNYQLDFSFRKRVFIGFLESFYLFNSVVNPFVYGIFDQDFRGRLKDMIMSCRR